MVHKLFSYGFLVLVFQCLVVHSSFAFPIKERARYFVKPPFYHFRDATNTIPIDTLASATFYSQFSLDSSSFIHDDVKAANWYRIQVSNQNKTENLSWYLEFLDFSIDEIHFYSKSDQGKWEEFKGGFNYDFFVRKIAHKNYVFPLDLRPGETKVYYVKIRTRFRHSLAMIIQNDQSLIKYANDEYWLLGLFYGIQFLIIFINTYLFIRLKDKTFLFYVFTVLSQVIYCFGRDGLAFQYLWPEMPFFNTILYRFAQFGMVFFTILYSSSFLQTRMYLPKIHEMMQGAIIVRFFVLIMSAFVFIKAEYLMLIDGIILSLPFISSILVLNKGIKYVANFVVGFVFLYTAFFLTTLQVHGIFNIAPLDWYAINIGIFCQSIFISMALLEQFSFFKEQNEKAQRKIIEQLRLTEQLKDDMNKVLQKKVEERTKELEEKNNTLDAFVYRASHDIKGPLNSIIGLTNLAQKQSEGTPFYEYFDHINKNSIRLKNLVTDLLQLSKVEQQGPIINEIDLRKMLDEIILSFSNLPDFDKVKITQRLPENAICRSDERLMYSVLQNLTENAIKYQDNTKEQPMLDVLVELSNTHIHMVFTDNGLGVPTELKEKIFDMFYKVDNKSNGTGLGLYIVKTAVAKLNGTIKIDSEVGKGTQFVVDIPIPS